MQSNSNTGDVICWWSGGVTSAVACKIAINLYGIDRCRIIIIGTRNEDEDTYRFQKDCEKWYGKEIEEISAIPSKYGSIQEVWEKFLSLDVAVGAICSSELKRAVRLSFEATSQYTSQVFGFDIDEPKRAKSMTLNYPNAKAIYPLLLYGLSKKDCVDWLTRSEIEVPQCYKDGFRNNNCWQTGCVKGGIGYWQKISRDKPWLIPPMAEMERKLTKKKGKPVTVCKDQSEEAKSKGLERVFLLPNPDYPEHKCLADMTGREPEPLFECNGFGCAVDDLVTPDKESNQTELFK